MNFSTKSKEKFKINAELMTALMSNDCIDEASTAVATTSSSMASRENNHEIYATALQGIIEGGEDGDEEVEVGEDKVIEVPFVMSGHNPINCKFVAVNEKEQISGAPEDSR